jgi:hypothetical protein
MKASPGLNSSHCIVLDIHGVRPRDGQGVKDENTQDGEETNTYGHSITVISD